MAHILNARQAVEQYISSGCTIAFAGFANGVMHAEEVSIAIEEAFTETGCPHDLTLIYGSGQGDSATRGSNHLGHEGLVTKVIGGHWGLIPKLQKLALENKLAAYNLPQGTITQLFRDIAGGRIGCITHVGLNTFVDPRVEGGKLNQKAQEAGDVVELITINGQEKLLYHAMPIHVGVIRASYADTHGNCVIDREAVSADALAIAQAAKNSGGHVIVQVERVVEYGTLDPRSVRIPGIYIDAIVVGKPENHMQTFGTAYNPAYSGEVRVPQDAIPPMKLNTRKVIARRAAMELVPHAITNLGIGMPEGVAAVAAEEGMSGMQLTTEIGTIGGTPASGLDFGATTNPDCILDEPAQFDFYDGGGLDVAFLGLAQMDKEGNINVSKFGPKIAGCGGFINITQNAKKVIYCGTFTAGGLEVEIGGGRLTIVKEGKSKKLIDTVEQITFSGKYAQSIHQPVLYVTERAVFELTQNGVELKEIAPGVDLQKDILDQMEFKPIMDNVKLMPERIFLDEKMGMHL